MKFKLCSCLLILLGFNSFAQTTKSALTDDLVKDKEVILAKYIPMEKGQYLYKLYVIPPEVFIKKMQAFKTAFNGQINKEQDAALKELKRKDVDFYSRNLISWYTGLYGMDSLGMENLEKVMTEKKGAPDFIQLAESAQKKAFVKKLSTDDKAWLTDSVMYNADFNDAKLFKRSAAYRKWVNDCLTKLRNTKYIADTTLGYNGNPVVMLKVINNEVTDPFIKESLNYETIGTILKSVKDIPAKEKAYNDFMAAVTNPAYKQDIQLIYNNYKSMAPGSLAADFAYPNAAGSQVSLKDLRGKYVYIDVWATWCAPCKGEIPFLTKVEEDYQGKNIHFVSLSVDNMKDKTTWLNYVKDHHLGGIQVMADKDFKSDFIQKFNINSIPRFILIDPMGKIVDADAKRPSDPELRKQLDTLL